MDACFCWPCCPKPEVPHTPPSTPVAHGGGAHAAGVARATAMDNRVRQASQKALKVNVQAALPHPPPLDLNAVPASRQQLEALGIPTSPVSPKASMPPVSPAAARTDSPLPTSRYHHKHQASMDSQAGLKYAVKK